jgi:hypothetical protein
MPAFFLPLDDNYMITIIECPERDFPTMVDREIGLFDPLEHLIGR